MDYLFVTLCLLLPVAYFFGWKEGVTLGVRTTMAMSARKFDELIEAGIITVDEAKVREIMGKQS